MLPSVGRLGYLVGLSYLTIHDPTIHNLIARFIDKLSLSLHAMSRLVQEEAASSRTKWCDEL